MKHNQTILPFILLFLCFTLGKLPLFSITTVAQNTPSTSCSGDTCIQLSAKPTKTQNTFPFGGRVLTTRVPAVTCAPPGAGPVVLMNNLVSLGSAVYSGTNRQQTGLQRAGGVASGVYGAIPYYTTNPAKVPKPGSWILGRHEIVPNISTCYAGEIPIPVKKTTNYNVSGKPSLR